MCSFGVIRICSVGQCVLTGWRIDCVLVFAGGRTGAEVLSAAG